jgi:hypothetical protein
MSALAPLLGDKRTSNTLHWTALIHEHSAYENPFTASTALSPPKANEFETAASIGILRAVFGT